MELRSFGCWYCGSRDYELIDRHTHTIKICEDCSDLIIGKPNIPRPPKKSKHDMVMEAINKGLGTDKSNLKEWFG